VVVEAGNEVWRNYKSGVVTQCPGKQSDHAVIAVGYGTSTHDYFKIKNSWGAQWGDSGYIYLQRGVGGKGMCNVVEGISFPTLTGTSPTTAPPSPSTDEPTALPTWANDNQVAKDAKAPKDENTHSNNRFSRNIRSNRLPRHSCSIHVFALSYDNPNNSAPIEKANHYTCNNFASGPENRFPHDKSSHYDLHAY
ncbi:hypothetical protein AeNC1_018953, partial [Aphanomyces euteiches]